MTSPAPRFVQLLRSLPGVRLFVPDGERAVVEYGFRHAIPLSACAPLFGTEELVLFRAGGDGAVGGVNIVSGRRQLTAATDDPGAGALSG